MHPTERLDRAREIVRRSHAVSPSPSLLRLEENLRTGDTNARRLVLLIESSPALAARVLRMANSAFYAPREPVVSLNRAVTILGDTVLRQLVLTSLIMSRHDARRSPRQALAAARLMGDAVRSAVVARTLADMTRLADRDGAFSAALLHDLGHVYLLDEVGDAYADHLLEPDEPQGSLAAEIAMAGTTHQEVGAVFAYEWNLPSTVSKVLAGHHQPEPRTLPAIIHASDWLVRELNNAALTDPETISAAVDDALKDLGLDRARWSERVPLVRGEYAELLSIFEAVAA